MAIQKNSIGLLSTWMLLRLAGFVVILAALGHFSPVSATVFRVDGLSGSDAAGCGSAVSPCATIQRAVNAAVSGDTILVSEGVYTDDEDCLGTPAVVCVIQKELTILGGFSGGDWSLPNPSANTTIIDGQNTRSGVAVRRGGGEAGLPATSLRMEGFTIEKCRREGNPRGFGGGFTANFSDIVLRDMIFQNNVAVGGSNGLAGGGGVAIQADGSRIVNVGLERIVFLNNQTTGGGGSNGAPAQGGGLFIDHANVNGLDLEFDSNVATGGASATTGRDGLGGAAAFSFGTQGTLQRVVATANEARGGSASTTAGSAFGGAIFVEGGESPAAETSALTLLDISVTNSLSRGGDASSARGGVGGGISMFGAGLTLERGVVIGNRAEGGIGDTDGNAGGGGIFLEWPFTSPPPDSLIRNTIIAENSIDGAQGGGGGLRLLGTTATATHVTLVDNRSLGIGLGLGILVGPRAGVGSQLDLEFSILADHTTPGTGRAVHVQPNGTIVLTDRSLFVGNSNNTNSGLPNSGTYVDFPGSNLFDASASTFFVNPATSDYHIDGTQPPTNSAIGSSVALDVDGASRSGDRDLGADEAGAVAFGLTVGKTGVGFGTVVSSPIGINCGSDCFEHYEENTNVALTATPDSGSTFTGWSGSADCTDGSVLMSQDRMCTAQFEGDEAVPSCSVAENELSFTNQSISNIRIEQACARITATSYEITETGEVTFEAPNIVLGDGFTVRGRFTAISAIP